MNNDEELSECFQAAGEGYGYDRVMARYADFRDLKVRWQRTTNVIEFSVSDYLRDAPDEVTSQLAETLFAKISGEPRGYPPGLQEWIDKREFVQGHRPVFLRRIRGVSKSQNGKCKNLADVVDRLTSSGLLTGDEDITVLWTTERMFRRYTRSSVVMKVVTVSTRLDDDDVPDYVLDWVVYREFCRILVGFDPNRECRYGLEDELAARYPLKEKAEQWIIDREDRVHNGS